MHEPTEGERSGLNAWVSKMSRETGFFSPDARADRERKIWVERVGFEEKEKPGFFCESEQNATAIGGKGVRRFRG
jgi:hypothetical protein